MCKHLLLVVVTGLGTLFCQTSVGEVGSEWQSNNQTSIFSPRGSHSSVVYNDKIWVFGGNEEVTPLAFNSEVWSSSNGVQWELETASPAWGPLRESASVVFDGKMWILGGHQSPENHLENGVWYSVNGQDWDLATQNPGWVERHQHQCVVFKNELWLFGGEGGGSLNDVWHSSDGITWTRATEHANWSARYGFAATVYGGEIWIFGGSDTSFFNDVWHSSDGINWVLATVSAPWTPRYGMTAEVYDGKMWLIGGPDLWSTTDGITWEESSMASPFLSRQGEHTSCIFNDKIWILGGRTDEGVTNDVSFSPVACEGDGLPPYDPTYLPTDQNQDNKISLSELLRMIQFYNSGGYRHCPDDETEDGYCPGQP